MNSTNSPDRAVGGGRGVRLDLLLVLGLELALVVALHIVGTNETSIPIRSLGDWLQGADPTVALVAIARLSGLIIGYWLLASTLLYAAAHHLGWTSLTSVLRWVTLPVVRRAVQGVTAISLTSASILGPAAVSIAPALAQSEEIAQGEDDSGESGEPATDDEGAPDGAGYPVDAAGWPDTGAPDDDFWRPTEVVLESPTVVGHTVVRGEHLWKIAEDHLRATVGREVTEDETCQYWVRLVDANRSTIRSGDPDLIYPLESITLPPVFTE